MPVVFNHRREIAVGAIPDTDPNTSAPGDDDIIRLEKRVTSGDKLTTGHELFFEFLDAADNPVSGPTVNWQTWFRNDQPQRERGGLRVWANMLPCTGAAIYEAFITEDVRNADLFIQILALTNPGTTAKIIVHVTEV